MAINFTFSQSGTSRFAQVIDSNTPKFLVGKRNLRRSRSVLRRSTARIAVKIALLLSFCVILNSSVFACAEIPKTDPKTTWETFRRTFPYHIQGLAYDQKTDDLIISEPPPHFTVKKFQEAFPEFKQMEVKETPIGCDGWVKDLVVQVPPMSEPQRRDIFDRINLYLFHTTYKADVLNLPAKQIFFDNKNTPLDVTITFSDLKDWLLDKNETFESVQTGEQIQFNDVILQKRAGVYFSNAPGLVIWAIDRKKPLNDFLAEARQFAVDSDLIVGSISDADMLVIAGRKRILPLNVFPPLRTETIIQLAAVKNPDLGQSYERNYVFAGRFNERDDWAPIYLSDELIDTEYGSLLNITDQILKRWSMKGTIDYKNFESYKDPNTFPFKDKTLVEYLNNASEVTFNWNTFGLGYSSETDGKQIFAINRTGALPTTYLSEDQDNYSEAEEKGYDYFAKVGDPNLTRVVQYAALYQIFQSSKVTVGNDAFSFKKYSPDYEELYRELTKVITEIKEIPTARVTLLELSPDTTELADAIKKVKAFSNKKEFEATARSILDPRNLNNQFNKRIDGYYREYRNLLGRLRSLEVSINSKNVEIAETDQKEDIKVYEFNSVCAGTTTTPGTSKHERCVKLDSQIKWFKNNIIQLENTRNGLVKSRSSTVEQVSNLDSAFGVFIDFSKALRKVSKDFVSSADADRLKEVYLRSLPERNSQWIHTPSIVISRNNDFNAVGGHNLNSKKTVFKAGVVPPGKVTVVQQGSGQTIVMNRKDINRMSSLVRTVAKNGDAKDIKRNLEQLLVSPNVVKPKPKVEALKLPANELPSIGGGSEIKDTGWFSAKRVEAFEDDVLTITKRADGSETVSYRNREITANTPTSRNDYISTIKYSGKDPARIRMVDFSADEAKVFTSNFIVKPSRGEKIGVVKFIKNFGPGGTRLVKDYDFANASIASPKLEVIGKGIGAQTKATIDITIPHSSPNRSGLSLRIENFFKGIATRAKQQMITQRLEALFGIKFRTRQYDTNAEVTSVISEIQNEIKKEFPEIQDAKFFLYDDITVSDNLKFGKDNDAYAE